MLITIMLHEHSLRDDLTMRNLLRLHIDTPAIALHKFEHGILLELIPDAQRKCVVFEGRRAIWREIRIIYSPLAFSQSILKWLYARDEYKVCSCISLFSVILSKCHLNGTAFTNHFPIFIFRIIVPNQSNRLSVHTLEIYAIYRSWWISNSLTATIPTNFIFNKIEN